MREKRESWTLRIQRSAWEPLRTFSKYTPARPEVKQAAETAENPLKGLIEPCEVVVGAVVPDVLVEDVTEGEEFWI